jgi:4'-phosphopantetheinyl transferase
MTVTIWWASPGDVRPWHASLLTEGEAKRAKSYRRDEDRNRFVTGNALLRLAIADRLGQPAEIARSCERCGEPHGKPVVLGSDLQVSVSHSGQWIAVALTELGPVGVDVEEIKENTVLDSMFRYVFSPEELSYLSHPGDHFYRAWARKESVLKATGEGLRRRMSELTVLPKSQRYNVVDLSPRPGYAAALTVLTDQPFTVSERDGAGLLSAAPGTRV